MRENRGFTIVELIVVIAMMAVAVGVSGYSIHTIATTRAKTTARNLKAALEETRDAAMNRGGGKLKLYLDADGNVWVEELITNDVTDGSTGGKKSKIGTSGVSVSYHIKDGAEKALGTTAVEFSFHPGTGAFTNEAFIDSITVTGGGKSVKLTLWKLTGRVDME